MVLGMSVIALSSAWDGRGGRGRHETGRGPHHQNNWRSGPVMVAEKVTVTGFLTIDKGSIALRQGDEVYVTPGLHRFVGFIDSMRDGAQAIVEGFAVESRTDPKTKYLRVTRLNVGGKDYDLDFDLKGPRGGGMGPRW
jgi:hypothetical protein